MLRKLIVLTFSLLSCAIAPTAFSAQSIDLQEVRYVSTGWGAEGVYVQTTVSTVSSNGCGPTYMIEPSHPMIKTMTAILLSAFYTGAKVNLYVDGCISPGVMNLKSVAVTK